MKLNGITCLSYGTNTDGAWYEVPASEYDPVVLSPQQLILTDEVGQYITSSSDSSPIVSLTDTERGSIILQTYGGNFVKPPEAIPSSMDVLDTLLGGWITNRLQAIEQFRRTLQLFAASLDETTALEVTSVYPVWAPGRSYAVGDYVTYGKNAVGDIQLYRITQAHISQEDWLPPDVPAIYTPLGLDDKGYPVWSQPTGAHDAYSRGDIVNHNGTLYKSLVDGNTWEPGTVANVWEVYTPEIAE